MTNQDGNGDAAQHKPQGKVQIQIIASNYQTFGDMFVTDKPEQYRSKRLNSTLRSNSIPKTRKPRQCRSSPPSRWSRVSIRPAAIRRQHGRSGIDVAIPTPETGGNELMETEADRVRTSLRSLREEIAKRDWL